MKVLCEFQALKKYKKQIFENAEYVKDPYTKQRLYQNKAEAIAKYGDNYNKHLVQIDHINPLENIHKQYKYNRFLDDEDLRQIANIKQNYQPLNGHMNQSKKSLSQKEYVDKHPEFSDTKRTELLIRENAANDEIRKQVIKKECAAVGKAFALGAAVGGAVAAAENIKSYQNGEIDAQKALANVAKDTAFSGAKAGVMTYAIKKSEEQLLKKTAEKTMAQACKNFVNCGGVAKAAICLSEAGKSTIKYIKGEINANQYAEELTEKGVSLASSFAVGAQGAVIGAIVGNLIFPGVGGVVGSMIGELAGNLAGYTLGSKIFEEINDYRKFLNEYNPEELKRYRELYDNVAEHTMQLREAYEIKTKLLYEEEATAINEMMYGIREGILENNPEIINLHIGNLCNHFGFKLRFDSLEEFDEFILNDTVEVW